MIEWTHMNNWFFNFHHMFSAGVASVGVIVSSVWSYPTHHVSHIPQNQHTTISANVTITPTVTNTPEKITVQKTITTMGKQVTVFLSMPKDGGKIYGSVSGDCQGAIDGNYSGQPQYTFSGKGEITCEVGFLSLPATATFDGKIHQDVKTADINYSVTSGSNFSKSGSVTVNYTE